MTITVLGEAIVDLIPKGKKSYESVIGGSPYNFARALKRNQTKTFYVSPISTDGFGDSIIKDAIDNEIGFDEKNRSRFPTSLAVVSYKEKQPQYALYRKGVADVMFDAESLLKYTPNDTVLIHTGSLMLVPELISEVTSYLEVLKKRGVLISLDLNLRPNVSDNNELYISGILDLLPIADIVKGSDEDLEYLGLKINNMSNCVDRHFQDSMLVFTKGSEGSSVFFNRVEVTIEAARLVNFVDTIGAGDTFYGFFVAQLLNKSNEKKDWSDENFLETALIIASTAASMNIEKKGCNPPQLKDVKARVNSNSQRVKY